MVKKKALGAPPPPPAPPAYSMSASGQTMKLGLVQVTAMHACSPAENSASTGKRQLADHVEEEGIVGTLYSLINVSIRTDDARGLSPKLQGDGLDALSSLLHDDLAHLCAACEGHLHSSVMYVSLSKCSAGLWMPAAHFCAAFASYLCCSVMCVSLQPMQGLYQIWYSLAHLCAACEGHVHCSMSLKPMQGCQCLLYDLNSTREQGCACHSKALKKLSLSSV